MDALKTRRNVLITGGSGTLGGPLSIQGVAAGWDVTVTYRSNPERVRAGRAVYLDFGEPNAFAALAAAVEPAVIIHTAVTERSGPGYSEAIRLAGEQVGQVAAATGARLIALSTDLVFDGRQRHYTEDTPPAPHPNSDYGRAKLDAERAMLAACPAALVVRTSLIYDFDRANSQAGWMVRRAEQGETLRLFTDQLRCPIWVWNLADALLELADTSLTGILHVVGPEPRSRYDLGRLLLAALGFDAQQVVQPAAAPDTAPKELILSVDRARAALQHTTLLTLEEAHAQWAAMSS